LVLLEPELLAELPLPDEEDELLDEPDEEPDEPDDELPPAALPDPLELSLPELLVSVFLLDVEPPPARLSVR
jgi:hypothetical protein